MDALNLTQIHNGLKSGGQARLDQTARTLETAARDLSPQKMESIRAAAEEFEGVFLSQMMSYMFESVEVDPMFGGGQGEEMFRSMMVEQYGTQLAAQGGIGLADQVQAKLIEIQSQMN